MAGIKRKSVPDGAIKAKKVKTDKPSSKRDSKSDSKSAKKPSKKVVKKAESSDEDSFDESEDEDVVMDSLVSSDDEDSEPEVKPKAKKVERKETSKKSTDSTDEPEEKKPSEMGANANINSSRESHAKQKALIKERKFAKPNADLIERTKKLWEKLRLKSHVDKEERKKLVKELFDIITDRVKDFVFKHDSVRVIQTAIKYSTIEQRRMIARELKGEFKLLAEGKYSKFLIAKLLEKNDPEIRDLIVPEFYGHVKRLINHPEGAWILDDTYRALATPEQKARLLREWYGPEFSIKGLKTSGTESAELSVILAEAPEKRKSIMEYLQMQINQLIQKKLSGFTMLHDAMLQYFLACAPGSSEANDLLEAFRPDVTLKEGAEPDNVDLLKNLAFTKSGSRLVSLAFAYGSAKDRKNFLKPYKDTVELMVFDVNAHHVLLAALAVVDDTKLTSKSIFGELLPSGEMLPEKVLNMAEDTRARTVLLYPFAHDSKWIMDDSTRERLAEIYAIRATTSKKDANTRQQEVARAIESQLLTAIAERTTDFASFGFGLQFMGEVLVGAPEVDQAKRQEALAEVVKLSQQILDSSLTAPPISELSLEEPAASKTKPTDLAALGKNMLKTLVQGGKFDPKTKKVVPVEPALGFADLFWAEIKSNVVKWATGQGAFVIVGLLESEDFSHKDEVLKALKKAKKELEAAAGPAPDKSKKSDKKPVKGAGKPAGNAGTRILLQKL